MSRDYTKVISTITNTPWLIVPENMNVMLDIINMRLRGEAFSDEEIRIRLEEVNDEDTRKNPRLQIGGGIGLMPMYGTIFPKANLFSMLSGGTSLEMFTSDLRELVANEHVETIVIDIDSGGGSSEMVMETGHEIRKAREVKPVVAVSNTMAGSAAYWLGAQANELYVTPSGKVGSIGVYTVHEDVSRQDEAAGRKVTFISAGRYKTAGNAHEPLSTDAKEYMQEVVDGLYEQFLQEVATGRNVDVEDVRTNYGQGKMLVSDHAQRVGMVNGVKSLDNVLKGILEEKKAPISMSGALGGALNRHKIQHMEHAPEEHADPDGGSPPKPREAPLEKDVEEGWRRDTPPIETEGRVMNDQEIRTRLGIGADDSIEDAVSALVAEVTPLREAAAAADARAGFASQFPEQANRLARLEERDRKLSAKEFAKGFESLEGMDGKGFSALCLGLTEKAALSLTMGEFTHDQLHELLFTVASNGIVDYSEHGTSSGNSSEISASPKVAFAAKVAELRTSDNLDQDAAVKLAAERHPDLFQAYRENIPVVRGG